MKVSIAEARRDFTKLIGLVSSGEEEEVVITKRGKPTAALVPYEQYEQFLRLQADLQIERWIASLRGRGLRAREIYERSRAPLEERPLPAASGSGSRAKPKGRK